MRFTACTAAAHVVLQELDKGKALLSGDYLLPSGTSLPFAAMVSKLRRGQVMQDIMQVRGMIMYVSC